LESKRSGWHSETEPAPVDGLAGVAHLAGEPIAQRWTQESKERIRSSREFGTARLLEGLEQADPRAARLRRCIRRRLLRRT
jgi:NAD dependent epimerase/dehydratase family enzyme